MTPGFQAAENSQLDSPLCHAATGPLEEVADPGMSYAERVERRDMEIQALKDAYCILDNKEAGCDGVF